MSEQDEKFLKAYGITSKDSDVHAGCVDRWLKEREARCRAEQSLVVNAQAYERITEAREKEIALWTARAWRWGCFAVVLGSCAVVLSVLLVTR